MQFEPEAWGVKRAFLQADASADPNWDDSPAFARPPAGVDLPEGHVWRLKRGKTLHGLRRAPTA
eukprot:4522869-Pyramimonas_sp.AAC.1